MAFSTASLDDLVSSPDTDNVAIAVSEPLTHSGRTSPISIDAEVPDATVTTATQKKKKKKKPKKSAKAKEAASSKAKTQDELDTEGRPPVLCISRNKHWRYISSYHVRSLCEPMEANSKTQPFARALGCNYLWNFLIPF